MDPLRLAGDDHDGTGDKVAVGVTDRLDHDGPADLNGGRRAPLRAGELDAGLGGNADGHGGPVAKLQGDAARVDGGDDALVVLMLAVNFPGLLRGVEGGA